MLRTFARSLRHRWLDESDARRIVGPELAERLRGFVAASERRHTGEIRVCVEGGLPTSYLWRHWRHAIPMAAIVRQRAAMMFAKLRVWDTPHNNGVLIYLLLAEHAIELVADRGIAERVPPSEWQAMVDRLGAALSGGQVEQGLTRALEEVSAVLVAAYPEPDAQPGTAPENRLPDEPVLR
ncbi:TPM domain-containing protein [Ottowia sp.]|uniref:TPM domain-containing protein n=1 Tax=Ottowia sp. TaxID=1898956 RepID=UPI002BA24E4D|nr:TPM domain-containing protein [Ottowia sp.]HOB66085.1 TPM domain-containing protein [Ottowia sp.]HPZ57797.1 TPM domain-containing protein [Ottowia sp.]HQD48028.1 TPM domain-containing protein [Ottowia sp.]